MTGTKQLEGAELVFTAPENVYEASGVVLEMQPTIRLRVRPGLRWLTMLLSAMVDVRWEIRLRARLTAPRGFSYDQVMARSEDRRLPAALGANP